MTACVVVALFAEAATRVGYHRVSRIQGRFLSEYRQAETVGASANDKRDVLVVGNSLLLHGVEFDRLHDSLSRDGWNATRLVLEGTFYYDWYYGLKEILRHGARPYAVVVMLTPGQWLERQFKGDYSAHFLVGTSDLVELSRELHLNPTQATNLAAAHVSEFWGARAQVRKFVLQFAIPDLDRLAAMFTNAPAVESRWSSNADEELLRRVGEMRALADSHGAKLVLVIPPVLHASDQSSTALERAGDEEHVSVLRVFQASTFARDSYSDGLHLNVRGADRFTSLLIPELSRALQYLALGSGTPMAEGDAVPAREN